MIREIRSFLGKKISELLPAKLEELRGKGVLLPVAIAGKDNYGVKLDEVLYDDTDIRGLADAETRRRVEEDLVLQSQIDGKQDTLTAGKNIAISNNVISATDTVYDDADVREAISREIVERASADAGLQYQIDALYGALLFIGTISLPSGQITQAALDARAQELGKYPPKKGYVLVDTNANDWWHDGTQWVNIGYYDVAQATNSSLGVVKGSTASMKVSVDGAGEMSVNGLQTALNGKQNVLNRTVSLTGKVTGSATDTGGALGIVTSVNLTEADIPQLSSTKINDITVSASSTATDAGTAAKTGSIATMFQWLREGLNYLKSALGNYLPLAGGTMTGYINWGNTETGSRTLLQATLGTNDQAAIRAGATANNAGYLEIATGDDGNEPIHVRQYSGGAPGAGTIARTTTLLDASGYMQLASYLHLGNANEDSVSVGGVLVENSSRDGYVRRTSTANFKNKIFGGTANQLGRGDGSLMYRYRGYPNVSGTTNVAGKPAQIRWQAASNCQGLTIDSREYLEGEIVDVLMYKSASGEKIYGINNSGATLLLTTANTGGSDMMLRFVKGASNLEYLCLWYVYNVA